MNKTLESVVGEPFGSALRAAINRKIASPSLRNLDDPERVRKLAEGNLRVSYLFARFVVPSYAAAIFRCLTEMPPVDDKLGPLVLSLLDIVKGELANNNIFDRSGECHAHYHDAKEAYSSANDGDDSEILKFEELERTYGIDKAIAQSSLWNPRSRDYAAALMECCKNPYGAVLLMAVNEEMAPATYKVALESLSDRPKFIKLRHFMLKHTILDSGTHGPAALQWLEHYVNYGQEEEAEKLVLKVLGV